MWKNSLYKWDSWIANRHKKEKECDTWCKFIIDNLDPGTTAVYNSGGMFFTDFIKDIVVIESYPGPVSVPGMQYIRQGAARSSELGAKFYQEFDNLIMINPIALKYQSSIVEFLTIPGISRAGYKPNIMEWMKPGAKIFLSTSDWHLYYDRLRFTVNDMVDQQLAELKALNIDCVYRQIEPVNDDIENGNIKLVLSLPTRV